MMFAVFKKFPGRDGKREGPARDQVLKYGGQVRAQVRQVLEVRSAYILTRPDRSSKPRTMIKVMLSFFLVLVAVSSTFGKYIPKTGKRIPQTLSRGWGDQLIWAQTYEEGLYWSRSRNKPLMVIFHLEDCPHSQALKKVMSEDNEIQRTLDQDFIVLNLVYETTDKHLSPDGQYVPRIIFVDPTMTVRADITGPYSNRMYAYEPNDVKHLVNNMKKAKKLLKSEL